MLNKTQIDITHNKSVASDIDFLTRLNLTLASDHNSQKSMNSALKLIGTHIPYDRVYILEIHPDMTLTIPYEWCNLQTPSIKYCIKRFKYPFDEKMEQQLYTHNYIIINESDSQINPKVKNFLQTKSAILLPLFESTGQLSFIVFSDCYTGHTWNDEEIRRLTALASIIATLLDKNRKISNLLRHLSTTQKQKKGFTHLTHEMMSINAQLSDTWYQIKESLPISTLKESIPGIDMMDQHINTFNKLCQKFLIKQDEHGNKP